LESETKRKALEEHLAVEEISAYLHFGALHCSPYFKERYEGKELKNALRFAEGLLRLPVYHSLENKSVDRIISSIQSFFKT
jgi:dTDP-4-amino-4,6-dideoxygalactose transaminase